MAEHRIDATDVRRREVTARRQSAVGLQLADLRRLVAEADALDLNNKATVYIEDLEPSYIYINRKHAKTIRVVDEHQARSTDA